jgi:hypothetical protein
MPSIRITWSLDFLFASEGEVFGKFNLSDYCLQIDDEGKATEEITNRMRKLAHVPIQTWRGVPMTCSLPWVDSNSW